MVYCCKPPPGERTPDQDPFRDGETICEDADVLGLRSGGPSSSESEDEDDSSLIGDCSRDPPKPEPPPPPPPTFPPWALEPPYWSPKCACSIGRASCSPSAGSSKPDHLLLLAAEAGREDDDELLRMLAAAETGRDRAPPPSSREAGKATSPCSGGAESRCGRANSVSATWLEFCSCCRCCADPYEPRGIAPPDANGRGITPCRPPDAVTTARPLGPSGRGRAPTGINLPPDNGRGAPPDTGRCGVLPEYGRALDCGLCCCCSGGTALTGGREAAPSSRRLAVLGRFVAGIRPATADAAKRAAADLGRAGLDPPGDVMWPCSSTIDTLRPSGSSNSPSSCDTLLGCALL